MNKLKLTSSGKTVALNKFQTFSEKSLTYKPTKIQNPIVSVQ